MTIAVLGFQLMIFVSMLIAVLMGRGWLKLAATFWVLLTLFGSIYTMGLMALQLITIYVSYQVCDKVWNWRMSRGSSVRTSR